MSLLLPGEKDKEKYVWTPNKIIAVGIALFVFCLLFFLMVSGESQADGSTTTFDKQSRQMERLVKAEESQAKSLQKISTALQEIKRSMR